MSMVQPEVGKVGVEGQGVDQLCNGSGFMFTVQPEKNNISADMSMNDQSLEEVTSSSTWEQPCTRVAPALQKSASGLPQLWPD